MGLPCRVRVNYRGYAVAVHRRLCYPHATSVAVCICIYIRGPGLLDERTEDPSLPHYVAGFALQGVFSVSYLASQRTNFTLVYLLTITYILCRRIRGSYFILPYPHLQ